MTNKRISHVMAIILMFIWSLSYLSIKVISEEVSPVLSAFYRFVLAAIILFILLKVKFPKEKVLKEDKVKFALGGLFGVAIYFIFENYAVAYTSASNVAILIASIPVFTIFTQRLVYKEKFTFGKMIGATLSLIGIIIIIASKERVSLLSKGSIGDLMALGAVFSWIIYNMVCSSFKGHYKVITITTYEIMWGSLFLSPSLFFSTLQVPSTKVVVNLIFLSIACSCIGYLMYVHCIKDLGATVLTTYINLQPIMSLIAAGVILHEVITIWQVLGCIVIIVGVTLVSLDGRLKFGKRKRVYNA
ncbi:DMT family transporter [Clostridium lacusfryxellense]|uniref:DMT family transporter n=1 Tax=Clostridium lacusfryxellense TaxID=205328 RepID=UPI001C0B83DE|nr:DMT family transporter [Clostridium lacusfryxellense]MBU3110332.1 DMT family transporter [Clostridium lacusfryxellense]